MIYAVRVFDPKSSLEKIVTVDAATPEAAYQRIARTGYSVVKVTPAEPGVKAGVVMNVPAQPKQPEEPREVPQTPYQRQRTMERDRMIYMHNLVTLWPIFLGVASILWGLFQWQNDNNVQAFISEMLGVILSAYGALRRWTRDQGPWR